MTGKNLRGQSAMEYLMTYGWALLVIVVVIAVLAWIMTLNRFDQCIFDPGFQCSGQRLISGVTPNQNIMFADITNGQKSAIQILGIACISGSPRPELINGRQWYETARYNVSIANLQSTEKFNIGDMTGLSTTTTRVQCYGRFLDTQPIQSGGNSQFTGTVFIAYKFVDENGAIPPKVAVGKITTTSQ